jgi:hypothetical protein
MHYWTSIIILYYFISVQPEKVRSSYSTLNMMISWQTVLYVRT